MRAPRSIGIMPVTENGHFMRDLQEASSLEPALVATLSHEIRTPLDNITGYWEMLADAAFEPYSPQWNDVVGRVQRSVRELLELVSLTLALAQFKADEPAPASSLPGREARR